MNGVLCFVLLNFYALTTASKPRSVNLALETTFEFNNKQDVEIIDKVRSFLNKIESVVDRKLALRSGYGRDNYEFSNFLQELLTILNSYDDDDFREVFKILQEEIRNQRYMGSKIRELMNNEGVRHILIKLLNNIDAAPLNLLRNRIKKLTQYLNNSKDDKQNTDFINFLNLLYKKKSSEKLKKILDKFKLFGRRSAESEINLNDIIRSTLKSLVYDHYSNLDESVRRDVKTWLETIKKNFKMDATTKKPSESIYIKKATKTTTKTHLKRNDKYKNKVKTGSTHRKTFVTLYPEAISLKTNKKHLKVSPLPLWKERTVPNKNYFYLVKDLNNNKGKGKGKFVHDEGMRSDKSSNSLEFLSGAGHRRNEPTTILEERFERQLKEVPTAIPKQILYKSLKYDNSRKRLQSHRKSNVNDNVPNEQTNETQPKESASAQYLDRIKKIEEELKVMKNELKAKTSSTTKKPTKTLDEYSDYVGREEDIFPTTVTKTLLDTNINETKIKPIDETMKYDAIFRANKVNDTKGNVILNDEDVSRENKEFRDDLAQNFTTQPTSNKILPSVTFNSTVASSNDKYKITDPIGKTETTKLPDIYKNSTDTLTEVVSIVNNITTQALDVSSVSGTTLTTISTNMSTVGNETKSNML